MNDFIPQGYKPPSTSGDYFKMPTPGRYRIRILTPLITGYVSFVNKKPIHKREGAGWTEAELDNGKPARYFMAGGIWNYGEKRVQTFTIQPATIYNGILGYNNTPEWGDPRRYDIVIERTGVTQNDTSYAVFAMPKSKPSPELMAAWSAAKDGFDLTRLYDNGHPLVQKSQVNSPAVAGSFDPDEFFADDGDPGAEPVWDDPDSDIPF